MENQDLWPDLNDVPKITSPRSILAEQANFLAEKTKNILNAQIKQGAASDGRIIYFFTIVAPLLKNYSYNLFRIYHSEFYYPCSMVFNSRSYNIENEASLKATLKEVFNDESTKRVLISLLGQSKDAEELK